MAERQKDPNEIGALWSKSGPKGDYLTGEINGQRVVCFKNKSQSEKAPTWRVLKSVPRDRDERPSASQRLDDRSDREHRPSRVDDTDRSYGDDF